MSRKLTECIVEGCTRLHGKPGSARGMCSKCYQMWRTYGRVTRVIANPGEGHVNKTSGYVEKYTEYGIKTYEHIMVAEKALGEKLPHGAVVHHVTENRSDNHGFCKLVICPSQSYHYLIHKLMIQKGISFKTGWPNGEGGET